MGVFPVAPPSATVALSPAVSSRFCTMRRIRSVGAIGLGLWSAAVSSAQTAPAAAMPAALRTHLKDERFDIVTSIRGLPLGVRDGLQTLWGTRILDIADPGAGFQGPGTPVDPALPARRLVAAGCSADFHCLVYYERGRPIQAWLVALFHWTPAATRFEAGGTAPGGLTTIGDVRNAVLSGPIKPAGPW